MFIPVIAGSIVTSPTISLIISGVIYPGRNIVGLSPVMSTIVDSIPIPTAPPSMIISILPSISCCTCCAVVGDGRPDRLALGAAIYTPESFMSLMATGCDGILMATVSSPPVVVCGTTSFLLSMMVSGPGQNASMSFFVSSLTVSASSYTLDVSAIWTMSGLSDGRPFAAYIRCDASGFSAFPPRPYTVSVGNATRPPLLSISASCSYMRSSSTPAFAIIVFITLPSSIINCYRFYIIAYTPIF